MNTKEKFLNTSSQLFRSQGYSGTGLKQIVTEAKAPWGSMYHFFPDGKEQLAEEAVLYAGEHDNERIREAFASSKDPITGVRRIFKSEMKRLKETNFKDGCPVASVATDVVAMSERVRSACSRSFSSWETTIVDALIEQDIPRANAKVMASSILSALEGATLLSRTHRSTNPLRDALKMLEVAIVNSLP